MTTPGTSTKPHTPATPDAPEAPAGLLAAIHAYETALLANDLDALDAAFVDSPARCAATTAACSSGTTRSARSAGHGVGSRPGR
ncbi:DUF3225 domain-containing protein [Curtobacterium flaccumfaciens]|nr:DUF3225 domain-containing protein [Curtobacterium flaccumfaciens]